MAAPDAGDDRVVRVGAQFGRWELVRRCGEGAFAEVWLAEATTGDEIAAVKVLLDPRREAQGRFVREKRLLHHMDGNFAPWLIDADVDSAALPWMAMEYISWPTLSSYVAEHGKLTGDLLLRFAAQLWAAVRTCARKNVYHRDLSARNVMVSDYGKVRLVDFGVGNDDTPDEIPTTDWLSRTPGFAAPEALLGRRVGPKADLWGWGAVVYFAATGAPLAPSEEYIVAVTAEDYRPDLSGVPAALGPALSAALRSAPDDRHADEIERLLPGGHRLDSVADATSSPELPVTQRAASDVDAGTEPGRNNPSGRRRPAEPGRAKPVAAPEPELTSAVTEPQPVFLEPAFPLGGSRLEEPGDAPGPVMAPELEPSPATARKATTGSKSFRAYFLWFLLAGAVVLGTAAAYTSNPQWFGWLPGGGPTEERESAGGDPTNSSDAAGATADDVEEPTTTTAAPPTFPATIRAIADDPTAHMAFYRGNGPGEICALGIVDYLDGTPRGVVRSYLWNTEPTQPVPTSPSPKLESTRQSNNSGSWTSWWRCSGPQYGTRRWILQAANDAGYLATEVIDVDPAAALTLPGYDVFIAERDALLASNTVPMRQRVVN